MIRTFHSNDSANVSLSTRHNFSSTPVGDLPPIFGNNVKSCGSFDPFAKSAILLVIA